tara:strand:- start:1083 stop:2348 length:1266 start_codon:yes stop_codon:yes gene_type:complete
MHLIKSLLSTILLLLIPFTSYSQNTQIDSGNTSWILISTTLVLFMTIPGLSLFYSGLVKKKNIIPILTQCFTITSLVSLLWLIIGYSLAFGDGGYFNSFIGGFDNFMLSNIQENTINGDIPESLFALFQMTFAIITPALIIGAFVDRFKFSSIICFTSIWVLFVYSPICHWVWGGGWLSKMGLLDFAGGTVVHITAGVSALTIAIYMGNRKDFKLKPTSDDNNMIITSIGAGMLWVGWFGFNGGSALAANGNASMAMLATHISASAGSISWMIMEKINNKKISLVGILTGMVAGLGTITPASGFVGPSGALIIGLLAGVICYLILSLIKEKLNIDDTLDVFSIHGVGGILGTLMVSIFASDKLGVFSGQGYDNGMSMGSQFIVQFIGVVATVSYTIILTFIILKLIDRTIGLKIKEQGLRQ